MTIAASNGVMKRSILEISYYDISGTDHPIDFMFGSRCLLSASSEPHRLLARLFVYVFISVCFT